jgi:hypothetical protein
MRAYQYVGPPEIRAAAESAAAGQVISGHPMILAPGRAAAFRLGPDGWEVTEVTNLSTGYCPDYTCAICGEALPAQRNFGSVRER